MRKIDKFTQKYVQGTRERQVEAGGRREAGGRGEGWGKKEKNREKDMKLKRMRKRRKNE